MNYKKEYENFTLDWSQPILVCITGASRGIGRTIALEVAKRCNPTSKFLLFARDSDALGKLKEEIVANSGISLKNIYVKCHEFSKPTIEPFTSSLKEIQMTEEFNSVYVFHNAGTVGELKPSADLVDVQQWRKHFDINFVSTALLNSAFLKDFKALVRRVIVVNVTSLCGRLPFKDMAMYGVMKAARDQYFRVIALENPTPFVTVLNYSPGPVDTDMYNFVADAAQSEEVRKMFTDGKKNILTPQQTVSKLLDIIIKDNYESGTTIDYFDSDWELRKTCLEQFRGFPPFCNQFSKGS